jgi:thioredoxin 1
MQSGVVNNVSIDKTNDNDSGVAVESIESNEAWKQLLTENSTMIVICKFTATWCKPCKAIQPLFESLAVDAVSARARTSDTDPMTQKFVTVDVDVLDDVASTYKVMTLPTFVAIQDGRVVDKYSGSNDDQLRKFVNSVLSSR